MGVMESEAICTPDEAGAKRRVEELLAAYSAQGCHLTGTDVDASSGQWLLELLKDAAGVSEQGGGQETGYSAALQPYELLPGRLTNDACCVELADGTRLEGRAIHNAASYADVGPAPLLEWPGEAAEAAGEAADAAGEAAEAAGEAAEAAGEASPPAVAVIFTDQTDRRFTLGGANLLNELRQTERYAAFLFVYTLPLLPGSDEVAMLNADPYDPPFGSLVVQLPPSCTERLRSACAASEVVRISCQAALVPAVSANVTVTVDGAEPSLPMVVVMTPRSGWGACASERAPGLACLAEALRSLAGARVPRRPVLFAATSGHELGHAGLHQLLHGLEKKEVFVWVHLGANIGASLPENPLLYQASDAAMEALLLSELHEVGRNQLHAGSAIGSRPVGEAREIFDRGGRFVSVLGPNARFHHPSDVFPEAVDVSKTFDVARAVSRLVRKLADMPPGTLEASSL